MEMSGENFILAERKERKVDSILSRKCDILHGLPCGADGGRTVT